MFTPEKFRKFVPDRPEGECWPWGGYRNRQGYGVYAWEVGGKRYAGMAHRLAYELLRGPIWQGLTLDHLCRNRACVNPSHLEQVTSAENIRRGTVGGPQKARTHCPQGHPLSGTNAWVRVRNGREHRECRSCRREAVRRWVERNPGGMRAAQERWKAKRAA